jgi:hypothetical protein
MRTPYAVVSLSALLFSVLGASQARAAERVACTAAGTTMTCRIDEPNVTRRVSSYPQITFRPGDQVSVSAGGCVQTGGAGRTWKRYVNPSGPNSDRLYHGLIQLPGVQSALVHVAGVVAAPVTIPATVNPGSAFLRLGYEDDNYSDNGYSGHDDGTENQCRGLGNAFVELRITHGVTLPPTNAPFDLVFTDVDPNGFPLNPRWAWQRDHPPELPNADTQCFTLSGIFSNPQCSTQSPSLDVPDGWNATWCAAGASHNIHGHVNWMPATWTGSVTWESHSGPGTDDDYNVNVVPANEAGFTVSSDGHIHCEFDSDETIDHFNTQWWRSFHGAVDNNDASARALIDGHDAIIVGLAGLDCEHGCATELHPVYALAIHLNDNPEDDTWAIFARNWGDEGYCSQDQHYLDANRIAFFLPRRGATSVSVNIATSFLTNSTETSGPGVTLAAGQGATVEFGLPNPEKGARINGELHLKWTVGAGGVALPHAVLASHMVAHTAFEALGPHRVETEKRLSTLEGQLTPEKRQALKVKLTRPVVLDQLVLKKITTALSKPARAATIRPRHDASKAAMDHSRAKALCEAFGGNVPGAPNLCATLGN